MVEIPPVLFLGVALSNKKRSSRRAIGRDIQFILGEFRLIDVFDEDRIQDLLTLSHSRIIGVYRQPTEKTRREKYFVSKHAFSRQPEVSNDNYIIGVGDRISSLSMFIVSKIRRHIIKPSALPNEFKDLPEKLQIKIAAQIEFKAVTNELAALRYDARLWYDEGLGIWQIEQSVIDEHIALRKSRKKAIKFDKRNEHGMVRSQRKDRQRPAGVSISLA